MKKIIIAHVSKQHSFHTAIALKRAGLLHKYVTTVYDGPSSLTMRLKKILKGDIKKKAGSRFCPELGDHDILQFYEFFGLLRILIGRFKFLGFLNFDLFLMRIFALRVANYAIRENVDAIIVYDGLTKKYLEKIKRVAPHIKTIMDVSIAARPYMKNTFDKDMERFHHKGFYSEEKFLWKDKYIKNIYNDFQNVDYFLAPSNVVFRSLEFCGVQKERILFIPYGVAVDQFKYIQKDRLIGPLKLLFVGNLSYRKGIHHLLDVVSNYSSEQVVLSLAGGYNPEHEFFQKYKGLKNIDFLGFVTRDIIAKVFQESDSFIMPSLGEGLALVILEALATGTPVLCTEMAGGNDAVTNYKNGIIFNASDRQSLRDSIEWMRTNGDKLPEMSAHARETSLHYTWESYYEKLGSQISGILK